jgi:hypothetical protein
MYVFHMRIVVPYMKQRPVHSRAWRRHNRRGVATRAINIPRQARSAAPTAYEDWLRMRPKHAVDAGGASLFERTGLDVFGK